MPDTVLNLIFLFGGTVLAFGIWALKNLILSRTKIRKASDQPLQLGEFNVMCKENMEKAENAAELKFITDERLELFCDKKTKGIRDAFKTDLDHAIELVNQQLVQGHKKFESLEKSIIDLATCTNQMKGSVDTLVKVVNENGFKK